MGVDLEEKPRRKGRQPSKATLNVMADDIAYVTGISKSDVKAVLNEFIYQVVNYVQDGRPVCIRDFGTFKCKMHKGHPMPFNDERRDLADYPVFKFQPALALSKALREDCEFVRKDWGSDSDDECAASCQEQE